ncbi:MAG: T9SS type A sorting domain-containing protein [Candidatus Micrarchaeota archaeon]
MSDKESLHTFFFDPSKRQFHWTVQNPFQPYNDWKYDQLEYRGPGVGDQFIINPVMYPNPAIEQSSVEFNWPGSRAYVELSVYDLDGNLIKPIFSSPIEHGRFRQIFDVRDLASGTYLIQGSVISFDPWERHPIGGKGALFEVVK